MSGRIDVICGCMFSGKTAELISRLKRLESASKRVAAVKHAIDQRYSSHEIVSRIGLKRGAHVVSDADSILSIPNIDIVGIDEAQFFGEPLVAVIQRIAASGCSVIVTGLDIDAWNRPFPPIPNIAAIADSVTLLKASCSVCGGPATYTQRTAPMTETDLKRGRTRLVGGGEIFEPRCSAHFVPLELGA